ncbi:hypothetical protein SAMN03159448_04707 [Sinorhizobium sp. NFACC03]|nr:hypothetical protein SAMN03159448_04707 [Sinorhizobium sp. NFACC03]
MRDDRSTKLNPPAAVSAYHGEPFKLSLRLFGACVFARYPVAKKGHPSATA